MNYINSNTFIDRYIASKHNVKLQREPSSLQQSYRNKLSLLRSYKLSHHLTMNIKVLFDKVRHKHNAEVQRTDAGTRYGNI